ncbi:MAG: hypothetical protein IPI87_18765 [Betaproteobacteria bacterium]|nr:hypothetical protein [Betaproteobacteria bacterium]
MSNPPIRSVKAGIAYFALVFGAGFVLGSYGTLRSESANDGRSSPKAASDGSARFITGPFLPMPGP